MGFFSLRCAAFLALVPAAAADPNVDIVIPASCPGNVSLADTKDTMVERERDNGELLFTLHSIKKNAPWVHKIFVLQNPGCEDFFKGLSLPEKDKTVWVNRCELFKEKQDCPSRNSFAVQTVVHRVPGLSELFIYSEDDDLVIQPTTIRTFFGESADKKEFLPLVPACNSGGDLYPDRESTGLTEEQVPLVSSSARMSHTWVPMKKSAGEGLEAAYPDFYKFVRSHNKGRYSSELNEFGTTSSDKKNSLEEDQEGVWWQYLCDHKMGIEASDSAVFQDNRIGDFKNWELMYSHQNRIILNINDDFSLDPEQYKEQVAYAHSKLKGAGFSSFLSWAMRKEASQRRLRGQ